jgi:8-oxo-dGTP pyrophosphatase MutT (NUDIX family)
MDKNRRSRWRMRLYLALAGAWRRMTLGTRVMLIDGDRIYLVRHTYISGWHLPGGGVEPGETAAAGAAREVREESAYRVTGPLRLFGLYHSTLATNRDHVALYLCRDFATVRTFRPNAEIAEFGWFFIDALPDGVTEPTRQRVAEVFRGAPQSEAW